MVVEKTDAIFKIGSLDRATRERIKEDEIKESLDSSQATSGFQTNAQSFPAKALEIFISPLKSIEDHLARIAKNTTVISGGTEANEYFINYPFSGTLSVPKGRTVFNFTSGKVTFPTGEEFTMNNALSNTEKREMQSLLIVTEGGVSVRSVGIGSISTQVDPKVYMLYYSKFSTIEVITTRPTSLYVAASTHPEGIPNVTLATYFSGIPYIANETISTGSVILQTAYDNAQTESLYSTLNRNVRDGYLINKGDGGSLYVWISSDGGTFYRDSISANYITINPNDSFDLSGMDINSIKIGASANSTSYQLVAQ